MDGFVEFLRWATVVIMTLLAVWLIFQWWKKRDQAGGWLALAFTSLAVLFISRRLAPEGAATAGLALWLEKIPIAAGVAFPYFLNRFAASFNPKRRLLPRLLGAVTAALVIWTLLLPRLPFDGPRPAWFSVYITAVLVHWLVLATVVATQFWRASKGLPGIARHRMHMLSVASVVLAFGIIVGAASSDDQVVRFIIFRLLLLGGVMTFFVALSPPSVLRAIWRRREEEAARYALRALVAARSEDDVRRYIVDNSRLILGAEGAALFDGSGGCLALSGRMAGATVESSRSSSDTTKSDTDDFQRVSLPFSFGTLKIEASPYTTFFGKDELDLVRFLGVMAELAMGRVKVSDREARLAAIVDSAEVAILGTTLDGILVTWNRGAERLFGYAADEIIGQSIEVIVPDGDRDEFEGVLDSVRKGSTVERLERQRLAKDGRLIAVSLEIAPVRDSAGDVSGVSIMAADITARQESEATMRRQAAALKEQAEVLDLTHDSIIMRDMSDRLTLWNKGAERNYGWSSNEALGQNTHDLFQTQFDTSADEVRSQLLKDGHWEGELRHITRDQQRIVVHSRWSLRVDQNGEPDAILEINNDITTRKRAEEGLIAAKAQAEAASVAKSEFLANMSHEIRTPMNGVVGMTALLLHTSLTDEQKEYAETIRHSADSLLAVINDVLDFSKIEAGRIDLHEVDCDPRRIVEEVADILASAAQSKGLELVTCVDARVPAIVCADPGRLRQVLLNLAGNAVKFTDAGDVVLSVSTEGNPEQSTVPLRFEVKDTGPGISREDHHRLFESFSQVDTSLTRRHGGTGLGLAISKRLVDLMDGRMGLESELGQGSTFWFEVPLRVSADAYTAPASHDGRGLKVLIVDDNRTNRVILERTLGSLGMETATASGGHDALEQLSAAVNAGQPFDIALLDFNMPEMTGLELAEEMDQNESLRDTARVLLTSSGERGHTAQAHRVGVSAHLTKPVRQGALLDAIVGAVGKGRTATAERLPEPGHTTSPAFEPTAARILIAEDNAVNQAVARAMVEKLGYTVDVVGNGSEALTVLEGAAYAAILMDCQMPDMDGYAATARIREIEVATKDRIPIIAMTAHAMEGDAERCYAAGMDDYLPKPVSWEKLEETLARWAGRASTTVTTGQLPAADRPKTGDLDTVDVIALEGLRAVVSDDSQIAEIVEQFATTARQSLGEMDEARGEGKFETINTVAHRLTGSCSTIGAKRSAALCRELIEASSRQDESQTLSLLDDLTVAIAQSIDSLTQRYPSAETGRGDDG